MDEQKRSDETIPGGRYVNADGYWINANGEFIDADGNRVDQPVKAELKDRAVAEPRKGKAGDVTPS